MEKYGTILMELLIEIFQYLGGIYMGKCKKKIILILLVIVSILSLGMTACAHSGRTDSNRGHRDNKNKSGLGSYHYHCGGYPAHLHTNGVCPYSAGSSTSTGTTSVVQNTIAVSQVKINDSVTSMKEGESQKLTVKITPSNATDKDVVWKSSDESIATISTTGEVIAKKSGSVDISVSSANGKNDKITINISELPKQTDTSITNTIVSNENNTNTVAVSKNDSSELLGGFLVLCLLGGVGYLAYKNEKNER